MGNQLIGVAPSQIFPVEHYMNLHQLFDIHYESSMGSTRFLKVARAKSDEGLVVVKVFVKHDPSLPLEGHQEKLEMIKKTLANAVNCLPFQRVVLSDKAAIVMREYVKHSLYDRVSTRPFLTTIEKKWITFQVLCALHQCHKQKICHGDIKLENILITSWNWVLLSDFASFKPTYLPEDNPADYNYFFDTSRRRTCYIAPERFVKTLSTDPNQLVGDGPSFGDTLLPEMDIFSAGCALLELWTEGTAPFEFSQLLAYRNDVKDLVTKHLQSIENERLRNLIASMLSKNPKDRKSAELYLDQERGQLFPEYFYSFLQSYIQMFSSIPVQPPDEKIMNLHSDIKQIIEMLTGPQSDEKGDEEKERQPPTADNDGLILISAVVTATIRGLQHSNSKLNCLEILQQLAANTASETILDRLLPFILCLTQDGTPNVRVAALDTLTTCLCYVKNLPRSDANVFPEYVLPSIAKLATDSSTIVRVAYAKNIATLAETAVNFLEQSQLKCSPEMPAPKYETELSALHEMLQSTVLNLLTDPQPIVKQTLMESGITKLCVFFGRQKANDVILSHIITFLNDKEDKNLRGSFFDCIVGVAAYVGWHCSPILIPLLQQGLADSEEFVIAKSIRATTALVELGLIQKSGLTEFISECACYLNHPNLWIRHEVCGLISTAAGTLSAIDVQCKIMPSIGNHLKCPLIQVEKPELLLDCLQAPIPRSIYDAVLNFSDINQLLEVLRERKAARTKVNEGVLPQYGEMGVTLQNLFRRLNSEGLNDQSETQLLAMSAHLIKLHRYRKAAEKTSIRRGAIKIDSKSKICRELMLSMTDSTSVGGVKLDLGPIAQTRKQRKAETEANMEWQLFSPSDTHSPSPTSPPHGSPPPVLTITSNMSSLSTNTPQAMPTSSLVDYSMPDAVNLAKNFSECRLEFDTLAASLKNEYASYAITEEYYDPSKPNRRLASNWKLQGTLVAHLHEHRGAVTKMTPLRPFGSYFSSVSVDGTVRLWDCNKLDGQQSINRSRQSYSTDSPLTAVAACDGGQSLAVAGKDGTLLLLRIDPNSNKMALQQAHNLDAEHRPSAAGDHVGGPVVDMQAMGYGGSQSMIVYATLYGAIVGWDIRMPGVAWRLTSDLRNGVITTFCVDSTSSWLAVGTSSGRHIIWDLRFKLPIAKIKHPHDARIRRVACHPLESSWLISASQGNNEVFVWNIETGHRQAAFWASSAPPLSNPSVSSSHSVGALLPGYTDSSGFLLTGGTDQRIRHWDVEYPENCALVVPAPKDSLSQSTISYDSRLIDGTRVIQEIQGPSTVANTNQPRSGPEIPAAGHQDMITDLVLCKTQKQTFVASSSRDGVIKLWK